MHAWLEIRRSRGEAIQSGFVEKEIIDEQLLIILHELLPQIREGTAKKAAFEVRIPSTSDVLGSFMLYPITGAVLFCLAHASNAPDAPR